MIMTSHSLDFELSFLCGLTRKLSPREVRLSACCHQLDWGGGWTKSHISLPWIQDTAHSPQRAQGIWEKSEETQSSKVGLAQVRAGGGAGTKLGSWAMGSGKKALPSALLTWCVQLRLQLRVEEVPDDGSVIFVLRQPAATGECHALSKRWGVHLYPVYKPAWSLAWREGDTEPTKELHTDGLLWANQGFHTFFPDPRLTSAAAPRTCHCCR